MRKYSVYLQYNQKTLELIKVPRVQNTFIIAPNLLQHYFFKRLLLYVSLNRVI